MLVTMPQKYEFAEYDTKFTKLNDKSFQLRHMIDEALKNIIVTLHIGEEEDNQIDWENLPESIKPKIVTEFKMVRDYPL